MSRRDQQFEPTGFSAGFINRPDLMSDEQRLFKAHCHLAMKGHASTFPLRLQATLSAPLVADQKGASAVKTMEIDTVLPLLVLPRESVTPVISVREMGEEGDTSYTTFYRTANGDALRSFPDFSDDFRSKHEYARAVVLDWAHKQFSAGIADMARSQMFDRIAFDRLRAGILSGIEQGVESLVFTARTGGGEFVERTVPPRLVIRHEDRYDRSGSALTLKLASRGSDELTSWTGILTSLPAELCATASRLRYAVMNATASRPHPLDDIDGTWDDDRVSKNGTPKQKDVWSTQWDMSDEIHYYMKAVRSMARDILAYDSGDAWFSTATVEAARWFSDNAPKEKGRFHPEWAERLDTLCAQLLANKEAFAECCDKAGWTLSHSPLTFIKARQNLFVGNDLEEGLRDKAEVAPALGGRRP